MGCHSACADPPPHFLCLSGYKHVLEFCSTCIYILLAGLGYIYVCTYSQPHLRHAASLAVSRWLRLSLALKLESAIRRDVSVQQPTNSRLVFSSLLNRPSQRSMDALCRIHIHLIALHLYLSVYIDLTAIDGLIGRPGFQPNAYVGIPSTHCLVARLGLALPELRSEVYH